MTKKHSYTPAVCILLLWMLWSACKQERQQCLTPKVATMFVESKHRKTDTSTVFVDSALSSAVFIALSPIGVSGRKYLQQQSLFTLSLSPDTTFCQWAFRTDTTGFTKDSVAYTFDTISFYYERNRQFLSNACGYTYFYTLTSVQATHKMIDSVQITNASVTNNVNTPKHVQIYIHPNY